MGSSRSDPHHHPQSHSFPNNYNFLFCLCRGVHVPWRGHVWSSFRSLERYCNYLRYMRHHVYFFRYCNRPGMCCSSAVALIMENNTIVDLLQVLQKFLWRIFISKLIVISEWTRSRLWPLSSRRSTSALLSSFGRFWRAECGSSTAKFVFLCAARSAGHPALDVFRQYGFSASQFSASLSWKVSSS